MKHFISRVSFFLIVFFIAAQIGFAGGEILRPKNYQPPKFLASERLQAILDNAIQEMLARYDGKFKADEVAATLIDLRNPDRLFRAGYRSQAPIYPASVVKMFYMAALEQQLEDGKIFLSPELSRGLRDMIVVSSNEATQYVLDVLTETSSGAELPPKEFAKWQFKRNRVNRFFASLGYTGINVNQKTFCEDAYGVEQQSRNYKGENRNMLTTDATARLLTEIALKRFVSPARSEQMLSLMKRDPYVRSDDPDDQAVGFTGKAFIDAKMPGVRLWSKAGWTGKSRHDAAYVETPDGLKFVLVVFTENHAFDREPIPAIALKVLEGLKSTDLH
ncbi:MAG: serine hydrolase [Blastocatellia bacterium]